MTKGNSTEFKIIAWTNTGRMVLRLAVTEKTVSLSGTAECDVVVPELEDAVIFINKQRDEVNLIYQKDKGSSSESILLEVGKPLKIEALEWLLLYDSLTPLMAKETVSEKQIGPYESANQFVEKLVDWVSKPMGGKSGLKDALNGFLKITLESTKAVNGLIVLAEPSGFSLAAVQGMSLKEAESTWNRMPPSLTQEILRTQARVLLPEGLRHKVAGKTTMFFQEIRSMAGFPVLAEGRLVSVVYLGFNNLMLDLSENLQLCLQLASNLMALVIQRAETREELDVIKLFDKKSIGQNYLPQDRLMVGSSGELANVYKIISRLAPVDVPTLIVGETGSGKELTAKEVHLLSKRAKKPFIAVNAAALPENLMESELFGHKKGSFTGALADHVGLVERANGGTLFIDEIAELSPAMQVKLLRVLQEKCVLPVGETTPRKVDFRLVSATHQDLESLVKQGKFREDLYYRIAGAMIRLPPLRERHEDILILANYFKKRFSALHSLEDKEWSEEAKGALLDYTWPGNIRELENAVARAFVMSEGQVIKKCDLELEVDEISGEDLSNAGGKVESEFESLARARDNWMKSYLIKALKHYNGRRVETAKALGIGQRTLFRYIEQLGIQGV